MHTTLRGKVDVSGEVLPRGRRCRASERARQAGSSAAPTGGAKSVDSNGNGILVSSQPDRMWDSFELN